MVQAAITGALRAASLVTQVLDALEEVNKARRQAQKLIDNGMVAEGRRMLRDCDRSERRIRDAVRADQRRRARARVAARSRSRDRRGRFG